MARQPQRPRRSASRRHAALIAKSNKPAATRARRRPSRSALKTRATDQPPARKVSTKRGRPAIFTREEILEAAKVAFSKGGYASVTLDDLAARLNTGKGSLYYHSSRKVDLLIAISISAVSNCVTELRKIASIEAAPQHRLALAMRLLMRGIMHDQQASKIYFENESDLPARLRTALRRQLREVQNVVVDILDTGAAAGVFRGDSKIVAKHILSVCAWPYRWFSADGALSLEAFIDSAVRFVLGGLLAYPKADRAIEAALASSKRHDAAVRHP